MQNLENRQCKYMISQISPRLVRNFLNSIRKGKEYSTEMVSNKLQSKGLLNKRDPILLRELVGIFESFTLLTVDESSSFFTLSEMGQKLKTTFLRNPSLFYELYHILNYYAFEMNDEDFRFLPFKSYQLMCDRIFETMQYPNAKKLADEIDRKIKATYQVQGSFSEACIQRGIAWLKELSPPVIDENRNVSIRKPDNVELLLFNISCYYKIRCVRFGDPLFLNDETVKAISKAVFIVPSIIEDNIKRLAVRFPEFIDLKYNLSGSIVVLRSEIDICNIL